MNLPEKEVCTHRSSSGTPWLPPAAGGGGGRLPLEELMAAACSPLSLPLCGSSQLRIMTANRPGAEDLQEREKGTNYSVDGPGRQRLEFSHDTEQGFLSPGHWRQI